MEKSFLSLTTYLVFASVLVPQSVGAYFTTAQSAQMLGDGRGVLYTVTYDFGMQKNDLFLPIVPERKIETKDQSRIMTYALFDDSEEETDYGESTAVVLSNAEIRDGYYFVPRGTGKRFVLAALLMLPETAPERSLDLALLVTNLPFTIVNNAGKLPNQLNPSELKYYLTPEVDIPKAQ